MKEIIDRVAAWRSGPAVDDISLVVLEIGGLDKALALPRPSTESRKSYKILPN
jgi:hypothetical protein